MSAIAVVMPVLDAERYLAEAVRSVLAQDGDVEIVAVDGGSTDATRALLATFGPRVRTIVRSGNQAAAIEAGVAATSGEILGFLNADDAYISGAFAHVRRAFDASGRDVDVVVGGARVVDADGRVVARVRAARVDAASLAERCDVVQPAAFVRRAAYVRAGGMNAARPFTCDYDLWVRLAARGRFLDVADELAISREHAGNKSSRCRERVHAEVIELLREHYGFAPFPWIYGALRARSPFLPRAVAVAAALPLGLARNPNAPLRYVRDWLRHRRGEGTS